MECICIGKESGFRSLTKSSKARPAMSRVCTAASRLDRPGAPGQRWARAGARDACDDRHPTRRLHPRMAGPGARRPDDRAAPRRSLRRRGERPGLRDCRRRHPRRGRGDRGRLRRGGPAEPQPAPGLPVHRGVLGAVPGLRRPAADARRAASQLYRRLFRVHLGDDDHRRHGDRRARPSAARRAALARHRHLGRRHGGDPARDDPAADPQHRRHADAAQRRLQHARQDHAPGQDDRAVDRRHLSGADRRLRARLRLGGHVRLRWPRARLLDHRHRRDGQLRQLVRRVQPGGAIYRHRLHAARGDVVRPLRAAGAGRAEGALRGQPDPRVPRDLCRARAGPHRRSGAGRRRDRRARRARRGLQPRLDHQHDRLHLDRLLALGTAGRGAVLLRDDDLRLLRLHRGRAEGVSLPAAPRRHFRRGPAPARAECRLHPALPGRAGLRRRARTRSWPSSCCSS